MTDRDVATALTIAGSDSGGGAGIVADAITFTQRGVWPLCAVTAVTAQDANQVSHVTSVPPAAVIAQITTVARGIGVDAAKTGLLPDVDVANAVADQFDTGLLAGVPYVLDPVMVASSGDRLAGVGVVDVVRARLLPRARVVTPNLDEVAALLGGAVPLTRDEMTEAARALLDFGCEAVLLTGGHLDDAEAADVLLVRGPRVEWLEGPRVPGGGAHGTGCVLSAAVAAGLAMGSDVRAAAHDAKRFVTDAIGRAVTLGRGAAVRPW